MNIKDGKESRTPSFIFILTPKPIIINRERPPEEMTKAVFHIKPTKRPHPPSNCNMPMKYRNLANLYLSNSSFIFEFVKNVKP